MEVVISLLMGFIFALGLGLSGMMNPDKVIGFLDVTGAWDPSLAFTMGGALLVGLIFNSRIIKRESPIITARFLLPVKKKVEGKMVLGAALFGIGWGMLGLCPGPALANLMGGNMKVILFTAVMIWGIRVGRKW